MKAVSYSKKLIVWAVFILSVLSLAVCASPVRPKAEGEDIADIQPTKTGTNEPLAGQCPQTVQFSHDDVSVVNLMKRCRARPSLVDIFNRPRKDFLEMTRQSPLLTLVCNGLVALVKDVVQKQEIASVCKDSSLGDMEVVCITIVSLRINHMFTLGILPNLFPRWIFQ